MKGAQSRRAAVFVAVALAALALVTTRLPLVVPRAQAQEPSTTAEVEKQLQARYSEAISLFEQGKYKEAKAAFEQLESMAREHGLTLGPRTKQAIADYLQRIEAELAKAEKPEEAEPEKPEEGKPAAAETTSAEPGPSPEEQARKARIAELEAQYAEAVRLYKAGKLEEARKLFHAVAAAGVRENLVLSYETEMGLRRYIGRIDQDIAEAKRRQQRRLEALAAKLEQVEELLAAGKVDEAQKLLQEWKADSAGLAVPQEQVKRAEALEKKVQVALAKQREAEEARKARIAELEAQYREAEKLYKAGKLEEAKAGFQAVASAAAREGLTLSTRVEKGLRRYLAKIDKEMAAAAEAAAKKEAEQKLTEAARREAIAAEKARREAAVLYGQAMTLLQEGNKHAALSKLEEAVRLNPDLTEAQQTLTALRKELGLVAPEEGLLEHQVRVATVAQQRAAREMDLALAQARDLIDQHRYDDAMAILQRVATRAEVGDFPAAMKQHYVEEARGLLAEAEKAKARYEAKEAARRAKEAAAVAAETARRERERRDRQIEELFKQAYEMFGRRRYDEAETAVRNILALDPANGSAQVLLDRIDRARNREEFLAASEKRARELRVQWLETEKAATPRAETKTIEYPENWRELTRRRAELQAARGPQISAEDQAVGQKLKRKITFSFADMPLEDVVDFLRRAVDVNIVVDQRVMATAPAGGYRVTLSLTDVPAEDALDFILDLVGLDWVIRRGVVFISDAQGVQAEAFMRIYDIRDLLTSVPDFAGPTFDLESEGGGGGGGGTTAGFDIETAETTGVGGAGAGPGAIGAFVSASQTGDEIAALIQENVARDTWGGGRNSIVYRDGNLIVVNTAEVHEEIQKLLQGLRQARALQVSMDIRFIRATDDFLVDVASQVTRANYTRGQHTLNFSIAPDFSIPIGSPRMPLASLATAPAPGLSLAGSFMDSLQVDYLVEAVESSNQAVLLSAPRLTVFNGQRAYIAVITQRNLVTDVDVSVAESAVGYDVTVDTITTGVVFDVRPIVSADRRYVQMDLQPSRSELIGVNLYDIGWVLMPDGSVQRLTIQQPIVETTEVRTTVSVPDGGTLMVGGLKFSFEQELESGVPILSQIPIINRLVTRTTSTREKDNLIVLVTPRIIIQEELEKEVQ